MEVFQPCHVVVPWPKVFSPKVIIRDGRECLDRTVLPGQQERLVRGDHARASPVLLDLSQSSGYRYLGSDDTDCGTFSGREESGTCCPQDLSHTRNRENCVCGSSHQSPQNVQSYTGKSQGHQQQQSSVTSGQGCARDNSPQVCHKPTSEAHSDPRLSRSPVPDCNDSCSGTWIPPQDWLMAQAVTNEESAVRDFSSTTFHPQCSCGSPSNRDERANRKNDRGHTHNSTIKAETSCSHYDKPAVCRGCSSHKNFSGENPPAHNVRSEVENNGQRFDRAEDTFQTDRLQGNLIPPCVRYEGMWTVTMALPTDLQSLFSDVTADKGLGLSFLLSSMNQNHQHSHLKKESVDGNCQCKVQRCSAYQSNLVPQQAHGGHPRTQKSGHHLHPDDVTYRYSPLTSAQGQSDNEEPYDLSIKKPHRTSEPHTPEQIVSVSPSAVEPMDCSSPLSSVTSDNLRSSHQGVTGGFEKAAGVHLTAQDPMLCYTDGPENNDAVCQTFCPQEDSQPCNLVSPPQTAHTETLPVTWNYKFSPSPHETQTLCCHSAEDPAEGVVFDLTAKKSAPVGTGQGQQRTQHAQMTSSTQTSEPFTVDESEEHCYYQTPSTTAVLKTEPLSTCQPLDSANTAKPRRSPSNTHPSTHPISITPQTDTPPCSPGHQPFLQCNDPPSTSKCTKRHKTSATKDDVSKQHVQAVSRKRRARQRNFQCDLCAVTCSNRGQLRGHLRTHTGERPFRCQEPGCNKSFVRNEELTRHRRIHSGERPYACSACGKAFMRKDHLNKHVRMHSNKTAAAAEAAEAATVDPAA